MSKTRSLVALFVAGVFVCFGATYSRDCAEAQGSQALHIDIPVKLEKANVVFDIGPQRRYALFPRRHGFARH